MMRNTTESRHTIQSVERAFAVLRTFTPERPVLGVSEIARMVRLNRTTVHRLLGTLEACGVVRRDPLSQRYTISAGVLQFSNVFNQVSDIRSVAMDALTSLRDTTQQTAALHVREGLNRITVAQVESRLDLRMIYPDLGTPIPLHQGAPGKVILANLSDVEREAYLGSDILIGATPHTVTDPGQLRRELDQIRDQGYAVTRQERRAGVISISAPVFDREGSVVGSLNVTGSVHRLRGSQVREYIPLVLSAAQDVSGRLGYHR